MNKVFNQINKYVCLVREFGIKIAIIELSLRIVGIFFRYSYVWKKISIVKYLNIEIYLDKFNHEILKKYSKIKIEQNLILGECPIWIYWDQGFDNAPEMVKACVESVYVYAGNHKINKLSFENFEEYVELPKYIMQKYRDGVISRAHFSDILRFALLAKYGGVWLDSTVFISDHNTLNQLESFSFYSIKHLLGENYPACHGLWSTFFLAVSKDNVLAVYVRDCLLNYWSKHNYPIDYLFLDSIIYNGYVEIDSIKRMIDRVPKNNLSPFSLINFLCDSWDEKKFNQIISNNDIHKMTYKTSYVSENLKKLSKWETRDIDGN